MVFYQCRKTGKPLSKHYKMYRCGQPHDLLKPEFPFTSTNDGNFVEYLRFSECAECGGRTTKCHPGEYKR